MENPKQELWLGDCLELMKNIPDKSIDMILCDLPYGTTACKWDSVIPLDLMWKQLKRIIKPNGAIVMTASQPFTTNLINSNIHGYSHNWVWIKSRSTGFQRASSQPMKNIEDVCVFYKRDHINDMVSDFNIKIVKDQLQKAFKNSGLSLKELNSLCRFEASGYLRSSSSWANVLPKGDKLSRIQEILSVDLDIPNLPNKTFNPQGITVCNKLTKRGRTGDNWAEMDLNEYVQEFQNYPRQTLQFSSEGNTQHPTQKPVALMEYLIKTYTNEGETVLDFTMGSGTTGVACKNLNRNFIGIELDKEYFEIAKKRIEQSNL